MEGNNRKVYDYASKEYSHNVFNLDTNQSLMVIALQFLNRPELLDGIFEQIPNKELILENCIYCEYRNYAKSLADIQLKRYNEAIVLLEETISKIDEFYLNKPLASAFIRSNRMADLNRLVADIELAADKEDLNVLYLFIGNEFLVIKNREMANTYFNKVLQTEKVENSSLAESYYLLEDYKNAELIFRQLHNEDTNNLTYISRLATCLVKNQKIDEGKLMMQKMESLRGDFQYGEVDYLIAQYYAQTDDEDKMFKYLLKSISQGNNYTISSFQNDPHFVDYADNPKFNTILTYWH